MIIVSTGDTLSFNVSIVGRLILGLGTYTSPRVSALSGDQASRQRLVKRGNVSSLLSSKVSNNTRNPVVEETQRGPKSKQFANLKQKNEGLRSPHQEQRCFEPNR